MQSSWGKSSQLTPNWRIAGVRVPKSEVKECGWYEAEMWKGCSYWFWTIEQKR